MVLIMKMRNRYHEHDLNKVAKDKNRYHEPEHFNKQELSLLINDKPL